MEKKEFAFNGLTLNGFLMWFVIIVCLLFSIGAFVLGVEDDSTPVIIGSSLLFVIDLVLMAGFVMLEPGEARVMMFFGAYRGTFTKTGYY